MAQQKRPAHEVILDKLEEMIEKGKADLFNPDAPSLEISSGATHALLRVLENMIIPEREHSRVLNHLARLSRTADKGLSISAANDVKETFLLLSHEKTTA